MKRILILGAIVVLILLVGAIWYQWKDVYPLQSSPWDVKQYRDIGSIDNLGKLLQIERWQGKNISKGATVSPLIKADKIFTGDVAYIFSGSRSLQFVHSETRPAIYTSFSTAVWKGRKIIIVGEKFLNKDGSTAILHFGFGDDHMSKSGGEEVVKKAVSYPNGYMMPLVKVTDCQRETYLTEICKAQDWEKVEGLVEIWKATGNIPKQMEILLLAPYMANW